MLVSGEANPHSVHLQKGQVTVTCTGGVIVPDLFTGISTWCAGTISIINMDAVLLKMST